MEIKYLVCLLPPENIAAEITVVQRQILRRTGHPGALALPPHLPLYYSEEIPESPNTQLLPQPGPAKTIGWRQVEGTLFLEVAPATQIQDLFSSIFGVSKDGYSPAYPGILMSLSDKIEALFSALPEPPKLSWQTSTLSCLKIESEHEIWWQNVSVEYLWGNKLKRRL